MAMNKRQNCMLFDSIRKIYYLLLHSMMKKDACRKLNMTTDIIYNSNNKVPLFTPYTLQIRARWNGPQLYRHLTEPQNGRYHYAKSWQIASTASTTIKRANRLG